MIGGQIGNTGDWKETKYDGKKNNKEKGENQKQSKKRKKNKKLKS